MTLQNVSIFSCCVQHGRGSSVSDHSGTVAEKQKQKQFKNVSQILKCPLCPQVVVMTQQKCLSTDDKLNHYVNINKNSVFFEDHL